MNDGRSQDSDPGDQGGLGLDLAAPATAAPVGGASPYRVLARKYRPSTFEDLIGQAAMVRTLSNAFQLGRIHQAYMLTGVRGVGKTTTARILARAFNYELPPRDGRPGVDKPTTDMPELGAHCEAIIDSRHIDVIEMDAASNTGVDDVREIIENARFRPVSARYKVYIIDEVHMLSKAAFNALLKTLEEPPDHVKFLFATTEIDKVPVTVRSRCQRFELRRVEIETLVSHLQKICGLENVSAEAEALALLARASEGSVRDALSLLDQAIAYGSAEPGRVSVETVNAMLGLADRGRIVDLFESTMKGDASAALAAFKNLYDQGADPGQTLVELAEFTHYVMGVKLDQAMGALAVTQDELRRGAVFAQSLSLAFLTRAWQILAKGVQDVRDSPRPRAAADMILVRLAYASDLPTVGEALRRLTESEADRRPAPAERSISGGSPPPYNPPPPSRSGAAAAAVAIEARREPSPRAKLSRFEDLVALAQEQRDIKLKAALERDLRLVSFEEGAIEVALEPGASRDIAQHLARRLQEWTGARWMVAVSSESGAPTLREQAERREEEKRDGVRADPLVRAVLQAFPGAEIVAVRESEDAKPAPHGWEAPLEAIEEDGTGEAG